MHTALDPQRRVDAGAGLQRNTLRTADPQSPEYILRRPGVTCSDPTTVAWGVAP